MLRLVVATAICIIVGGLTSEAVAEPVSESTVEKACGDQIEGGCAGKLCATGCTKNENGKIVDYGCTFPNKTGKTKATCNRIVMNKTVQGTNTNRDIIGNRPVIQGN